MKIVAVCWVVLAVQTSPLWSDPSSSIATDALAGAEVVTNAGEFIGKIREFVRASDSGRLRIAVVQSGGYVEAGEKTSLVPYEAFQMCRSAEQTTCRVILEATVEKLQGAIQYDPSKPILADQVYAYWGLQLPSEGEDGGGDI